MALTNDDNRLQVRVEEDTTAWLRERGRRMLTGSHHQQARVELAIWRTALAAELHRIRLTLAQVNCLADVMNGTLITAGIAGAAPIVFFSAADSFQLARDTPAPVQSSYGAKWAVDEELLLRYLRTLGPTADHALHDAISQWRETGKDPTAEGWAAVGLTVTED